jgi:hypothetical protein
MIGYSSGLVGYIRRGIRKMSYLRVGLANQAIVLEE